MKSVYIWGIGAFYKRQKEKLRDWNIIGYIDNKFCLENELFEGKRAISSNQITADMTIIIMAESFVPMVYELIHKRMTNFKIGTYMFPESYQEELLMENGIFEVFDNKLTYKMNSEVVKIETQNDINKLYVKLIENKNHIENFDCLPVVPFCRNFGITRGTPIDRIYIEKFLDRYKEDIRGDVIEIAENTYTVKFGENRLKKSYILHVMGWGDNAICGNLETGEGIEENQFDSAILTQTLMFIFNLERVINNIYKMLKPGGVALITVSGISQISRYDAENWGAYWSFYKDSLIKLFEKKFDKNDIKIETYGNVKTATGLLYGISAEEVSKNIFEYHDEQYPVIYGIRVKKKK